MEFKSVGDMCDVISHVVFCPDDGTMMVTSANKELWIPSVKVTGASSWESMSNNELKNLLGSVTISSERLTCLSKVTIPDLSASTFYHCVLEIKLKSDAKKKIKTTSSKYQGQIRWLRDKEILQYLYSDNVLSPELVEFCQLAKSSKNDTSFPDGGEALTFRANEYHYKGILSEINADTLVTLSGQTPYESLVEAASFTKEVQTTLLKLFILFCFPALYMCQRIFTKLMSELGWPADEITFLFRAADTNGRSALSFRDFLYILAAIEPGTIHGGGAAEIRCKFIFRYYDRDRDNVLSPTEFKLIISASRKLKRLPIDAASVKQEADSILKTIGLGETSNVTIAQFLKCVSDLKFRGTSQLFRLQNSINAYIKNQGTKLQGNISSSPAFYSKNTGNTAGKVAGPVPTIEYVFAQHSLRILEGGTEINIQQLTDIDTGVSASSTGIVGSNASRRMSLDQFNQQSLTNELIKSLRFLAYNNKKKYEPLKLAKTFPDYNWGPVDPSVFCRQLSQVCDSVKKILREEKRMISLTSPIYVLGDLHGNFPVLLEFEKSFWCFGPALCPCSLLFLGDYVDRGVWSIEVITYLLCFKAQFPDKIFLIRGNHEVREVQKSFSFYEECNKKFGEKLGPSVWNLVNTVFDVMPLAATIDGQLFCCHGGIPPPWLCPTISALYKIPIELSKPAEQSSLAWELMWNDPVKQNSLNEQVAMELMANEGFANNKKRGTAHIFSYEALDRFLNTNGYSNLIRAHEVVQAGFQF
ncbi:uncharacterized protein LOC108734935 isoform X2 [Agrilus planipennis]|uniref:Serine/threonine-protein phosphatase n=1 Tax=Agrilus planipennis TaxID=224129 RepID=A0A1W4WQ14_AGRPL|nr:uncharacterized protein LOC108734935 isoform X2 [Agrilus planipennis]